jgi:hypothetical protein
MRTDVRDVGAPDFVWLSNVELSLQVIWCHHGRNAATFKAAPAETPGPGAAGAVCDPLSAGGEPGEPAFPEVKGTTGEGRTVSRIEMLNNRARGRGGAHAGRDRNYGDDPQACAQLLAS